MSRWKHKGAPDPHTEQSYDIRRNLWLLIQEYGEEDVRAAVLRIARPTSARSMRDVQAIEKDASLCNVAEEFSQFMRALEVNQYACHGSDL